jgi:hypothetical protein
MNAVGPVLMLDFDGVLHPASGGDVADFARLPLLEEVLADLACHVVISSTWREHYSMADLQRLLGSVVGSRVIDVLGPDQRGSYLRYRNIQAWLEKNPWGTNWRALDDSVSEFPPGCAQLILCDGREGMSMRQMHIISDWLQP